MLYTLQPTSLTSDKYDFRGHTRGTLVVGIAYGCPYYKGSAIFSLVFLSTTSEKSFIPY